MKERQLENVQDSNDGRFKFKKSLRVILAFSSLLLLRFQNTWSSDPSPLGHLLSWTTSQNHEPTTPSCYLPSGALDQSRVREYNLTISSLWTNPDGGHYRPHPSCNGLSPCPLLSAAEGDILLLHITNDLYTHLSLHVLGLSARACRPWLDGVSGLTAYPVLPRGNATYSYDTRGAWGLFPYIEHVASEGVYGAVWVAPGRERERPYYKSAAGPIDDVQDVGVEGEEMLKAELDARHAIIKDNLHRDTGWKVTRMRAEGTEIGCADSLLVNGKGRVVCYPPEIDPVTRIHTDARGCVLPVGQQPEDCFPTTSEVEVFEVPRGRRYMFLNVLNAGFRHEVFVSVDGHEMIVVGNDAGFVQPRRARVVYLPPASRLSVLVRLDPGRREGDFPIRIVSANPMQRMEGFAVLRYGKDNSESMVDQDPAAELEPGHQCVHRNGTFLPGCTLISTHDLLPFPSVGPPSTTDITTVRLRAGSRPSATKAHVPEYFLHQSRPWPLFHAFQKPLLFHNATTLETLAETTPIVPHLPLGAVVDLVIENSFNLTLPLYKHGDAGWLLGSGVGAFVWKDTREAVAAGAMKMEEVPRLTVHEVPPLGWSVLKFRVERQGVTAIHAAKIDMFALGMWVPLVEGITDDTFLAMQVPDDQINRPHVEWVQTGEGVFD